MVTHAAKKVKTASDRSDPMKNKSLAVRNVLKNMPNAKAAEIAEAVKKEYGHNISPDRVYMVKTKSSMAATRKVTKTTSKKGVPVGAAQWIAAIKIAQELLKSTGSVDNATALLHAIDAI